jgi:hypothetical protein
VKNDVFITASLSSSSDSVYAVVSARESGPDIGCTHSVSASTTSMTSCEQWRLK